MNTHNIYTYFFTALFLFCHLNLFAQNPYVLGIVANACGNEGNNELFFFQNGSSTFDINDLTANYNGTIRTVFTPDVDLTAALNNQATCSSVTPLFVSPADGLIPPYAKVLIFTSTNGQADIYDFNILCGTGPYYVFEDQGSNGSGSQFPDGTNGACNAPIQNFSLSFGSGIVSTVSWSPCNLTGTDGLPGKEDGALIMFSSAGTPSYLNYGCNLGIALPIILLDFQVVVEDEKTVKIFWETSALQNEGYFVVERVVETRTEILEQVPSKTTERSTQQYTVYDSQAQAGKITYYLYWFNEHGEEQYAKSIEVFVQHKNLFYPNPAPQGEIFIPTQALPTPVRKISYFDELGKIAYQSEIPPYSSQNSVILVKPDVALKAGIYFLEITTEKEIISQKLLVR